MSAISTKCCCGGIGCADCFISDADSLCCRLHPDDVLMFRIQRPAWSKVIRVPIGGTNCPCTGIDAQGNQVQADGNRSPAMRATIAYSGAHDILAMYKKFTPVSTGGERAGFWFYDNGSFGKTGGVSDCDLWRLWPDICPQKQETQTAAVRPACCGNTCRCSSTTAVGGQIVLKYTGPSLAQYCPASGVPIDFVCSTIDDGTTPADNSNLTVFQKAACLNQHTDKTLSPYDTCLPNDSSTAVAATCKCDYDGEFIWLDGIMDDYNDGEQNAVAKYRHWYWNGSAVVESSAGGSYKRLSETIVSVFHKEKWFKQCDRYDGATQPCEQVGEWACQVPEYWVFACAGVPVFSWEIGLMQEAGHISSAEMTTFFQNQFNNEPIPVSIMDKLETRHWLHGSGNGYGILQLKDWGGTTLPTESSAVATSERRIVRKDLARYSFSSGSHQQTVARNLFYNARRGGWTHVCRNPPTNSCDTPLTEQQVAQRCPQVPRAQSCKPTGGDCDFSGITQGTTEDTEGWDVSNGELSGLKVGCLNAWPFPQCNSCTEIDTCTDGNGPCAATATSPCAYGQLRTCGNVFWPLCQQTTFRSECDSIRFQWSHYIASQLASASGQGASTPAFPPDNPGVVQTNAYLFILNQHCDESDSSVPKTCAEFACLPGPDDEVPIGPDHVVPPKTTKDLLCNRYDLATILDGARYGLTDSVTGPNWFCPGADLHKAADTSSRDPGLGQKDVPGQDCGRYLGADQVGELGACCKTQGGTTTCVDAMTLAQCLQCNNQSGISASWQGKDSCCDSNPCS